jgi:hypothetical protein
MPKFITLLLFSLILAGAGKAHAAGGHGTEAVTTDFPTPLEAYGDQRGEPLMKVLSERVKVDPFNLVATILFFCAIIHTFLSGPIRKLAHKAHHDHEEREKAERERAEREGRPFLEHKVSFKAEMLHFFGEVEAVFGLWVVPLMIIIAATRGLSTVEHYLNGTVIYTEPMFVVVIMTMAATRPIVKLAEQAMSKVASIGGGSPAAWWFSILTIGPLLGSFITEPAAMTISALLLAGKFFGLNPSNKLKYGTIGLLFVNVSVGGTLTHFAAPPVLMVARTWGWDTAFMLEHYGWKAVVGIIVSTTLYYLVFRKELKSLAGKRNEPRRSEEDGEATPWQERDWPVPAWITIVHLLFMAWTVFFLHYPVLFIGGFLFFMAFVTTTFHHQEDVKLKPALLVGFFLAGLVTHGGLQQWWIEPVLSSLSEVPLMLGATFLTAFNDNAAITYLASLVPEFTDPMKYAVVAGAVTGGGLTVIANAPNPAGQSILQRFFEGGVSPLGLVLGAIVPTIILGLAFMTMPF